MTDINLLPWRRLKREQDKINFIYTAVISCFLAFLIIFLTHLAVNKKLKCQLERNVRLKKEVTVLNRHLSEMNKLKKSQNDLLRKINEIHQIQLFMVLLVHLFDELTKIMVSGVYLIEIKHINKAILIKGRAESNLKIAFFLKKIENNKWIRYPLLTEIKRQTKQKEKSYYDFKLRLIYNDGKRKLQPQ